MSNFQPTSAELGLAGLALSGIITIVITMAGLLKRQSDVAPAHDGDFCDNQCMTQLGPYIAKNIEVNSRLVTLLEQSQATMTHMVELTHSQNSVMQEMLIMLRSMSQDLRDIR